VAHTTVTAADVTSREREVWSLVAAHLTNREIAERLYLSVRTVESHVSSLIQKLQVADRRALARHPQVHEATGRRTGPRWPLPASSFVGRASECAALRAAIDTHRMVTITGPGGVGKTRLALQVIEPFAATRRDGGCFVDLVHVSDPLMVVGTVAAAAGVAAPLGGSLVEALASSLADSDAVLLLDNCEHVLDAVRDCVARLLRACPSLAIVATSRMAFRAPFEWVFPVPGLSLGEGGDDAVALFVERASAAGADATVDPRRVRVLCASLSGVALAIELAAARCPALGLDGLIAGLDHGLQLLTSGAGGDDRHRSLREAIAWSYRLLSSNERNLLAAISVFASSFDVDAALAVADPGAKRFDVADGLARLADHSLLFVVAGESTRYRALETIRQFGAEQLEQLGRSAAVHERHWQWCRAALAALAAQPHDDAWCEHLDRLAPDVRTVLARAIDQPCGPVAAQLAEWLAEQLLLRGRPHESQRCYEQAALLAEAAIDRARLLRLAAGAAASRLVGNDTLRLLREAANLALASDDPRAAAVDIAWMVIFLRWAPGILAVIPDKCEGDRWLAEAVSLAGGLPAPEAAIAVAIALGTPDDDPRLDELIARAIALAREAATPLVESVALDQLCASHLARAELLQASETTARREEVLKHLGFGAATAYHFNDYLLMASEVHLAAGRLQSAAEYADRLAELACYRDYPHPALARRIKVDAIAGDFDAAVTLGDRFLVAWEHAGRPISGTLNVTAYAMAMVHGLLGDEANRTRWIEVTRTLTFDPARLDTCASGWAPTFDALLALDRARPELALERLSADIDDRSVWNNPTARMWRPWYAALWVEAAVLADHADAAARLARAASATRENAIAAAIVERAGDFLRGRRAALSAHAGTFARLGCDYQRRRTETLGRSGK
jgi:predicted ATPase/DNA-binding CsgD family transcriptional regulator